MSVIYPVQIEWHAGNWNWFTEKQVLIFYKGILQPTGIKKKIPPGIKHLNGKHLKQVLENSYKSITLQGW